jgi:hypothetical protein
VQREEERIQRLKAVARIAGAKKSAALFGALSKSDAFEDDCKKMFERTAKIAGTHARLRLRNYQSQHGRFAEASL